VDKPTSQNGWFRKTATITFALNNPLASDRPAKMVDVKSNR
jgi:hypothetical protein